MAHRVIGTQTHPFLVLPPPLCATWESGVGEGLAGGGAPGLGPPTTPIPGPAPAAGCGWGGGGGGGGGGSPHADRQPCGRWGPRRALLNRGLWLVTHPSKPKALR